MYTRRAVACMLLALAAGLWRGGHSLHAQTPALDMRIDSLLALPVSKPVAVLPVPRTPGDTLPWLGPLGEYLARNQAEMEVSVHDTLYRISSLPTATLKRPGISMRILYSDDTIACGLHTVIKGAGKSVSKITWAFAYRRDSRLLLSVETMPQEGCRLPQYKVSMVNQAGNVVLDGTYTCGLPCSADEESLKADDMYQFERLRCTNPSGKVLFNICRTANAVYNLGIMRLYRYLHAVIIHGNR